MKIQNLKTKIIGPVLLLLPMACMHLGDGHHSGGQHSSVRHPSHQSLIYAQAAGSTMGHEWMIIHQDSADEK
ncbi:MAG: hypothetical protein A2V86_15925 [Deltaproteobacteria bacterium RBG_16_49_23]|nr:MAG: hypothetical protein A2V86_15925 [Deltaproteobacteria bacterium RBG_16_49_23]